MQTLNLFGYAVANRLGRQTEHNFIEVVKQEFKTMMPLLLRRSNERNVGTNEETLQSVYLTLETYNFVEDQIGLTTDPNIILRTVQELPAFVSLHTAAPFSYVGNPNGLQSFTFTPFNNMRYIKCNEVGNHHTRYTYANNRVYVINSTLPKFLLIRGVAADPQSIEEINQGTANCLTDDDTLPYPADLVALAYTTILGTYQQSKEQNNQIYVGEQEA